MKNLLLTMVLMSMTLGSAQKSYESKTLDISSGYFLGTNQISKKEFKNIISKNQKAYKEFKKGRTIKTTGIVLSTLSAGYLGWSLGGASGETDSESYIAGGLVLGGGFLAVISGQSMIKKSVRTYNKNIEQITFELNTTPYGLGLAINF